MKVLGLVLARSGSKGVPGKNIRKLNGRPLIEYTIEQAKIGSWCTKLVVPSRGSINQKRFQSFLSEKFTSFSSSDSIGISGYNDFNIVIITAFDLLSASVKGERSSFKVTLKDPS